VELEAAETVEKTGAARILVLDQVGAGHRKPPAAYPMKRSAENLSSWDGLEKNPVHRRREVGAERI